MNQSHEMPTVAGPTRDLGVRQLRHEHYKTAQYLGTTFLRLLSYRMQLRYTLASEPKAVLVVGKGDGIVPSLLEAAGVAVTTLDVAADVNPDILGSVDAIPTRDAEFDATVCCQVLEHLPFDRFDAALYELRRVTRGHLILSLPDVRRFASITIRVPRLHIDFQRTLPRWRTKTMPPDRLKIHGHHWEIGFRGTEYLIVKRTIERCGWMISGVRRIPENPWHTFFYCATPNLAETISDKPAC